MPKDNEVDEKVMPEPLTYGMRRKGETAVIGLIPPKVHANPPKVPEYLRDYEEVPLYSAATVEALRTRDESLKALLNLLREYKREYDTPIPDYNYRHLLRAQIFTLLGSIHD